MIIQEQIKNAAKAAVQALYNIEATEKMVQLQETRPEFEGQLTLVVFPFVKAAHKAPEQVGEEIGSWLRENCAALVSGYNVVKGFLNLSVAPAAWIAFLKDIRKDSSYGFKLLAQHPQAPAPGARAQQPSGLGIGTGDDGCRTPCG